MKRDNAIETIARDHISGSRRITEQLADLIATRFAKKRPAKEARRALLEIARVIIPAHGAMAPVVNLFNHLFNRLNRSLDPAQNASIVARAAEEFAARLADHGKKIADHVFALVQNEAVVLTHSASHAVLESLDASWARGKRFSVICTESRPMMEGRKLARLLAAKQVPTCLVTDAQAFALLKGETEFRSKVDLVLVGADAISRAGVTNKTGTLGLAVAARSWSVPFYVLAGSEKFLPRSYPVRTAIREKPAREILAPRPPGLSIINRYFDITPLADITGVVTEKGLLSGRRLIGALENLRLHPLLRQLVQEIL
ncbi:MAG TPA: hypothetical protein VNL14_21680 [Candidatus Acidoferrales bacterium]|nr:hypothetical protein [Candidatus Acidoferrales bacterium]